MCANLFGGFQTRKCCSRVVCASVPQSFWLCFYHFLSLALLVFAGYPAKVVPLFVVSLRARTETHCPWSTRWSSLPLRSLALTSLREITWLHHVIPWFMSVIAHVGICQLQLVVYGAVWSWLNGWKPISTVSATKLDYIFPFKTTDINWQQVNWTESACHTDENDLPTKSTVHSKGFA